jgi:hypothetical protein
LKTFQEREKTMASKILADIVAAGSVDAAGAAVSVRGAAVATTGAGVYTITLDEQVDSTECAVLVTPRTTADIAASVVQTSDTVKTVNMRTIAAAPGASNCAFDFLVVRTSGGYAAGR